MYGGLNMTSINPAETQVQAPAFKGLKKGLKDGEVIGSEKKAVENAKNALSLGLDNDTISKITGLSIKEIVALK